MQVAGILYCNFVQRIPNQTASCFPPERNSFPFIYIMWNYFNAVDNELVTPYFQNSTVLKNSTRAKTLRTYQCWVAWGGGEAGHRRGIWRCKSARGRDFWFLIWLPLSNNNNTGVRNLHFFDPRWHPWGRAFEQKNRSEFKSPVYARVPSPSRWTLIGALKSVYLFPKGYISWGPVQTSWFCRAELNCH